MVKTKRRSFTLIEVLVSSMIILVGAAFLLAGVVSSRIFLKKAENRESAVRAADTVMQKFLTRHYEKLDCSNLTCSGKESTGNLSVDWNVNIQEKSFSNPTSGQSVPYKEITLTAAYQEDLGRKGSHTKRIIFKNIVPYSYIHVDSKGLSEDGSAEVPADTYADIPGATITVRYRRDKDILFSYNITLNIEDYTGIEDLHTIYTRVVISPSGALPPYSLETRTPIKTQPFISNVVTFSPIERNKDYTFTVQWYKDVDSGKITLRDANIMVVAIER